MIQEVNRGWLPSLYCFTAKRVLTFNELFVEFFFGPVGGATKKFFIRSFYIFHWPHFVLLFFFFSLFLSSWICFGFYVSANLSLSIYFIVPYPSMLTLVNAYILASVVGSPDQTTTSSIPLPQCAYGFGTQVSLLLLSPFPDANHARVQDASNLGGGGGKKKNLYAAFCEEYT